MSKKNLKAGNKLWGEFEVLPGGSIEILKAKKLVKVNQHTRRWKEVSPFLLGQAIEGRNLRLK